MSKIWVSVLFLVVFFSISVPNASADVWVYNATIKACGFNPATTWMGSTGGVIFLVDNSATPLWTGKRQFYMSTATGNQGLATVLTAFSMGKNVSVKVAGDASAGSLVQVILLEE